MSEDKRNDAQKGKDAGKESDKQPASKPKATGGAQGNAANHQGSGKSATKPAESKSASAASPSASKAASDTAASPSDNVNKSRSTAPSSGGASTAASGSAAAGASPRKATHTSANTTAASGSAGTPPPARAGSGGGRKSGRTALLVAIIAIIVAFVAIVGAGWLWYRGQQKLAALDARVNTVEQSMQSNVQDVVMPRMSKFDQRLRSLSGANEQQSKRLSTLKKSLATMQHSVQATQTQTAELADRISGNANRWDLNQIEALLRAANQRLQLYDDPQGARQALQLASDAIGRQGDPRLFKVRSEIVNEIAALRALPDPDIEGLSLQLAAMVKQVPDLPLASSVPKAYKQESDGDSNGDQSDAGDGMSLAGFKAQLTQGWEHFKDSVGKALSGMLTIRRANGTQSALLPPDQVFFLNQNLQLQLRTARLALLERNTQGYRDSLASARQWLGDYYDSSASPVSSLRDQLDQMSNVKLDWEAPDISQSLSMLRDLMTQRAGGGSDSKAKTQSGKQAGQGGQ